MDLENQYNCFLVLSSTLSTRGKFIRNVGKCMKYLRITQIFWLQIRRPKFPNERFLNLRADKNNLRSGCYKERKSWNIQKVIDSLERSQISTQSYFDITEFVPRKRTLNRLHFNKGRIRFRYWRSRFTSISKILSPPLQLYRVYYRITVSRDSSVGIATDYGPDDQGVGVRVPVGSRIFSSRCPDRLWGPHSLLPNGNRGLIPRW
jgi:hypothetical protein